MIHAQNAYSIQYLAPGGHWWRVREVLLEPTAMDTLYECALLTPGIAWRIVRSGVVISDLIIDCVWEARPSSVSAEKEWPL